MFQERKNVMSRFTRVDGNEYDGFQLYNGEKASEGFSREILDKIIKMMNVKLQRHSQVLMVLLQFNFPVVISAEGINNQCFQNFIESYQRRLTNQGFNPDYLWVREVGEINNRVHYHLILLFNGNKIRYFSELYEVRKYWLHALQQFFEYNDCIAPIHQALPQMKRGIMLRRNDPSSMEQGIGIASYLAKIATKDISGKFHKSFSCSQFEKGGSND